MPRVKTYNEHEVLEKAMNYFWIHGYESASMQELEVAMGINKFSIYSSFGSKYGLLLESIKCYVAKLHVIIDKLQNASGGINAIKQFFYDFLNFSKENHIQKGCLLTNLANECSNGDDSEILNIIKEYTSNIRNVFASKLEEATDFTKDEIEQKADFLFIAMYGFATASKVFSQQQIEHYISHIFKA
ncbi:TetR/AcrR family transcriptional regulator [Halosquirtibacter laminarini]|uniref:TetR/AcrR family transcriptional regulator n=1 Tax=Halosquirtibacter laminarini TaxID=3374600 RepID=A0AC61NP47_9BACT|nr:TetR/AcrR family transcriptional regulator [Prolixibacteraceae bacterium]